MSTILEAAPAAALALLVKASVMLAVAAAAQAVLRRRASAAMRHGIWTLAIVGLLALPLLSSMLPPWGVRLPSWPGVSVSPPAPHNTPAPVADRWIVVDTHDAVAAARVSPASPAAPPLALPD